MRAFSGERLPDLAARRGRDGAAIGDDGVFADAFDQPSWSQVIS